MAELRADLRPERVARWRWKNWMDITALLGVSILAGAGVFVFLMMWSGA